MGLRPRANRCMLDHLLVRLSADRPLARRTHGETAAQARFNHMAPRRPPDLATGLMRRRAKEARLEIIRSAGLLVGPQFEADPRHYHACSSGTGPSVFVL